MRIEDLTWQKLEESEDSLGAYAATGARGAQYTLIRNAHHPQQLFAVSGSRRVLPGWYTDRTFAEDGKIRKMC